ncbi:MAG: hypothetical protein GF344_17760 [Chitinivibrionales bacterium]|nr:hypothetical protein [Chitinivibrionales bacterium]MBD3358512.1 hypothetical protein [Chitinivibrionales bacterium]
MNMTFRITIAVCLAAVGVSTEANDAALSLSFLAQGNTEEARIYAVRGFAADSAAPLNRFAMARVITDANRARTLYRLVARDASAADSMRAAAYARLGEYSFVRGEYDTARALFGKAATLSDKPGYQHNRARALHKSGNTEAAEGLWATAAANDPKALFHLGGSFFSRKRYKQALNSFSGTAQMEDSSIVAPSLAMAAVSASKAGFGEEAEDYGRMLVKRYPFILEEKLLREAGAIESKSIPEGYSIQVGAFGRPENAKRLKEELSRKFGTVSVVKERNEMRTLHKVWIGSFDSEHAALDYGERMVRPLGMPFRVVKR